MEVLKAGDFKQLVEILKVLFRIPPPSHRVDRGAVSSALNIKHDTSALICAAPVHLLKHLLGQGLICGQI